MGDAGIGQAVDDGGIDAEQFCLVKPRRRAAKAGKVKANGNLVHVQRRIDRVRRAEPGEQGDQGFGFDPLFAQGGNAQRAEPLGQLALGADQQRFMGEARRLCAQCGEHLDLGGGVGHVILSAQHVGNAHVDIVDHAGQHIQP